MTSEPVPDAGPDAVAAAVAAAVRDGRLAVVLVAAPGRPAAALRAPVAGAARILLAALGGRPERDDRGRPVVRGADLRLSLSYTAGAAAVALCASERLGVDVEAHRPIDRLDRLVAFVSPAEERAAAPADPADRLAWFYRTWTRKEAVLKAWGTGFAVPPVHVRVPADAGRWGAAAAADGARPAVVTRSWAEDGRYVGCAAADVRDVVVWRVRPC